MNNRIFPHLEPIPICAGTGLVALDVVLNGQTEVPPRFWAGGSCGNVLTILSFLGWKTFPIIRLGEDEAANRILMDWQLFGVSKEFIDLDDGVSTPIIVERICLGAAGSPTHKFFWLCPNCGAWLPRFRPIRLEKAKQALKFVSSIECFYFDRVSPGAITLAIEARKTGAIVFFEPPSLKNDRLFEDAIKASHIVKVANGHSSCSRLLNDIKGPNLVIQTLGVEGIRYRIGQQRSIGKWKCIPPFPVSEFRDAAGAGDWCSAGIIYSLTNKGQDRLKDWSEKKIIKAIELGQAMAALCCSYEGARGNMYAMNRDEFEISIKRILQSRVVDNLLQKELPHHISEMLSRFCPKCTEKSSSIKKKDERTNDKHLATSSIKAGCI